MLARRLLLLGGVSAPAAAWASQGSAGAWAWLLGITLGWVLVRFRFGFSGPLRRAITGRDPRVLHPLALLVLVLVLGSAVVIGLAGPLGLPLDLAEAPLRPSLAAGAFLFGIGMQLAGRCGSGTLASAAQPEGGFGLTLAALLVGVFAGSLHRPLIERATPAGWPPVSLLAHLPLGLAVLVQLGILALLLALLHLLWRHPLRPPEPEASAAPFEADQLVGAGALGLAMLLLLLFTGDLWRVLWGLALTAAHLAQAAGWDSSQSAFWGSPARQQLLASPLQWIRHPAVVINLGVIYGAVLARSWWPRQRSGHSRPGGLPPNRHRMLAQAIGGLLMGYGGFLSYGCNISSFLGGVISFSLHGWVWLLAAFAGSITWLRLARSPLLRQWLPGG
jgi:uncharacterized membrane protein YedE/YeeE